MQIIVNGQRFVIDRSTIDYQSVVELLPLRRYDVRYTVTWKRSDGAAGTLVEGQLVSTAGGTVFNVSYTGRA